MTSTPFFPPSARILVGATLLLVAVGLAAGQGYSVRQALKTLEYYEQNRSPGDSAGYASARYHAAPAQAARAGMWGPSGYASLGTAGAALGLGLIAWGLRGRRR